MKSKRNGILVGVLAAVTVGAFSLAHADDGVSVFAEAPKDLFTPTGFDDNDNVQVVLEGAFSNLCFHTAPTHVQVDQNASRVYIDNSIYSVDRCKGGMMYVPYTRVVDLGVLQVGNYEVWVTDGQGGYQKRAELPVRKAKSSPFAPDDELYAPVSEVSFNSANSASGNPSVTIRGALNNSCLVLRGVQVLSHGNVIEILPQAALAGRNCVPAALSFSKTVELPAFPSQGDVLIHVRSMGGQSVNRVITELDRIGN